MVDVSSCEALCKLHLTEFQELWKSGKITEKNRWAIPNTTLEGANVLQVFAYFGLRQHCKWLIDNYQIQTNLKDQFGRTYLHYIGLSAQNGNNPVELLSCLKIANGLAIDEQDNDGNTVLHYLANSSAKQLQIECIQQKAKILSNKNNKNQIEIAMKYQKKDNLKNDLILLRRVLEFEMDKTIEKMAKENRFSLSAAYYFTVLIHFCKLIKKLNKESVEAITQRWGCTFFSYINPTPQAYGLLLFNPLFGILVTQGGKITELSNLPTNPVQVSTELSPLWKECKFTLMKMNCFDKPLFCTGHGVGGAMATLVMNKLVKLGFSPNQLHLYTFGQTRVATVADQQEFDDTFEQAYTIIREGDGIVNNPPMAAPYVGGYHHCGTLRLITQDGKLFNDNHYQFHDIRRKFLVALNDKTPIIQQFRLHWTAGLQMIQDQEDEQSLLPSEENLFTTRPFYRNKLQKYLEELQNLTVLINTPDTLETIENKITKANSVEVVAPSDLWDERIKGVRHQREKEKALLIWIGHYTEAIPAPYRFSIQSDAESILNWFEFEKEVLITIQAAIEFICTQFKFNTKQQIIPESVIRLDPHTKQVSSLVEIGFLELIHLTFQIANENFRWEICKKFFFGLPAAGYFLKSKADKNKYSINYSRIVSPYRQSFIDSMKIYNKVILQEKESLPKLLGRLPYQNGIRPCLLKKKESWTRSLASLFEKNGHQSSESAGANKIFVLTDAGVIGGAIVEPVVKQIFENRNVSQQILKQRKKTGINPERVYGRRLVWKISTSEGEFYIKECPELPGLERASFLLSSAVIGSGIPFSCVGRLELSITPTSKSRRKAPQAQIQVIPILISKAVPGLNLQNEMENEEIISKLDEKRFSELFLLTILTLVEDGKPDNFIIKQSKRSGKWKLNAIDNDHILVPPFTKSNKLNLKTILFCLPQMRHPVDSYVIEQFCALNLEELLLKWLEELAFEDKMTITENQNPSNSFLFTSNEVSKFNELKVPTGDKCTTIVTPVFEKDMIYQMYVRMRSLQTLWRISKSRNEALTHFDTLQNLLPDIHQVYSKAFLTEPSPLQRFIRLTSFAYAKKGSGMITKVTSEELLESQNVKVKNLLQQPASKLYSPQTQMQTFSKWIKVCEGDTSSFTALLNALNKLKAREVKQEMQQLGLPLREYFFHVIVKNQMKKITQSSTRAAWQRMLISSLKSFHDWTRLNLSYFEFLDDASLQKILSRNSNLEELYLSHCTGLTQIGLMKSHLTLPRLYKLDVRYFRIKQLNIALPKIQTILADTQPTISPQSAKQKWTITIHLLSDDERMKVKIFKLLNVNLCLTLYLQGVTVYVTLNHEVNDIKFCKDSDCFVILVNDEDPTSFRSAKEKWSKVRECYPLIPCSIVCIKSNSPVVSHEELSHFALSIRATNYFEITNDFPLPKLKHILEYSAYHAVHYHYNILTFPSFSSIYYKYCFYKTKDSLYRPIVFPPE